MLVSWLPLLASVALAADPIGTDLLSTNATTTTLPNGLVVILEPQLRTDLVALHVHYGVGSRDQAAGQGGCAHLFEHLMFEGSAHVPNNAFDDWLTAAGGDNNAWTSEDETVYHMTYPSGAQDLGLFLESDRMGFLDAGVTEESVKNQQDVVLRERAQGYAAAHGRDWDALTTLLYPEGHPYHSPVIGTEADIRAFSVGSTQAFWHAHYRSRNAVMALVGNFTPTEALAAVERWWSDVPDAGPAPERVTAPPLVPRRADGMLEDQVEDWTLYMAWPSPPRFSDDAPAAELLAKVLSFGRGTRLDDALYFKHAIASETFAYQMGSDLSGALLLYASTPKSKLAKVSKVMEKVVADLTAHPPTTDELDRARQGYKSELLDELEAPEGRAQRLVDCQVHYGTPDCLHAHWAKYEAVTPADLVRIAQTWLTPDRRITLSVVPQGRGGALSGANPVELP